MTPSVYGKITANGTLRLNDALNSGFWLETQLPELVLDALVDLPRKKSSRSQAAQVLYPLELRGRLDNHKFSKLVCTIDTTTRVMTCRNTSCIQFLLTMELPQSFIDHLQNSN